MYRLRLVQSPENLFCAPFKSHEVENHYTSKRPGPRRRKKANHEIKKLREEIHLITGGQMHIILEKCLGIVRRWVKGAGREGLGRATAPDTRHIMSRFHRLAGEREQAGEEEEKVNRRLIPQRTGVTFRRVETTAGSAAAPDASFGCSAELWVNAITNPVQGFLCSEVFQLIQAVLLVYYVINTSSVYYMVCMLFPDQKLLQKKKKIHFI